MTYQQPRNVAMFPHTVRVLAAILIVIGIILVAITLWRREPALTTSEQRHIQNNLYTIVASSTGTLVFLRAAALPLMVSVVAGSVTGWAIVTLAQLDSWTCWREMIGTSHERQAVGWAWLAVIGYSPVAVAVGRARGLTHWIHAIVVLVSLLGLLYNLNRLDDRRNEDEVTTHASK